MTIGVTTKIRPPKLCQWVSTFGLKVPILYTYKRIGIKIYVHYKEMHQYLHQCINKLYRRDLHLLPTSLRRTRLDQPVSLVILDVARCYLWLFTLYINIKISKNSC